LNTLGEFVIEQVNAERKVCVSALKLIASNNNSWDNDLCLVEESPVGRTKIFQPPLSVVE
jgi:hypothetical protein